MCVVYVGDVRDPDKAFVNNIERACIIFLLDLWSESLVIQSNSFYLFQRGNTKFENSFT